MLAGGVLVVRLATHPSASAAADLRLRATVEQWRVHEVDRTVAVALHNDGDQPVRVDRVELDLPSFEGNVPVATTALLPPGGLRVDVPLPYGTGRCPPDAAAPGTPSGSTPVMPASAPSAVLVDAAVEGQPSRRTRLALPHPNRLLDKLLRDDCRQQHLRRVVAVELGDLRPAPDATLTGTIAVRRVGAPVPLTLHDFAGSVLIGLTPAPAGRPRPLGTLPADRPRLDVAVRIGPERCDAHAVAEVKKPYEFPVWLSLGGGERLVSTVTVAQAERRTLDRMVRAVCKLPE